MSLSYRFGGKPAKQPAPGRAEIYGAVIRSRSDKYLLVQGRKTGKWSFPKGHTNSYETPFECVCREVGEEVGIDNLPQPIRGLPLRIGYYYYFEMEDEIVPMPRDMSEIQDARWVSKNEMCNLILNVDASEYFRNL